MTPTPRADAVILGDWEFWPTENGKGCDKTDYDALAVLARELEGELERCKIWLSATQSALARYHAPAVPPPLKTEWRLCDCPAREGKCQLGLERTLQTTELSRCLMPRFTVVQSSTPFPCLAGVVQPCSWPKCSCDPDKKGDTPAATPSVSNG